MATAKQRLGKILKLNRHSRVFVWHLEASEAGTKKERKKKQDKTFVCLLPDTFLCCRNWEEKKQRRCLETTATEPIVTWSGKKKELKEKKHAHCACLGDRVFEISKCTTSLQAHSEQNRRKRSDGTETTSRKRNVLLQGNWSSCGHFHGYKRGFWPTKQEICFTVSDAEIIFITAKQSELGGGREARKRGATEEKKKNLNFSKWCSLFFVFFATHACPQPLTSTLAPPPASHLFPRTHPLYISITPAIMSEEKDGASGSIFVRPFLDFRWRKQERT